MTEGSDINRFGHDPEAHTEISPYALTSFDEAKKSVENGEADGMGFVVTRHDPFLVVELTNCLTEDDTLLAPIEDIIKKLGETFTERDVEPDLRLMYKGELPTEIHGGPPVSFTIQADGKEVKMRMYDSGWTPITGQHVSGTPKDCNRIDHESLRTVLESTGVI